VTPVAASETVLNLRNCGLLLRRAGAGPAVLFLHGAGGFPKWLPFFDRLAKRFALMVPDHPSFGRSSTPDWLDDVADLAYFYLDLLADLKLKDVHVIGHSMGGWIALEMAIRSTERIKSLSLIAPAGIRIKGTPIANIFLMDRATLMHALYADQALAEQELAVTPTPAEIDTIVANQVAAARLGWQPRFFNPKLRKWLHRVTVPTQIVWGAEDKIIPPVYAAEFAKLIPGATVTMVPKAGHVPHAEKADEVTSAIANFITRNG
jgi:pimeloyl-ACP methyl ester carboxylesterase